MMRKVYLALAAAALACFGVAALLYSAVGLSGEDAAQAPTLEVDGRFVQLDLDDSEAKPEFAQDQTGVVVRNAIAESADGEKGEDRSEAPARTARRAVFKASPSSDVHLLQDVSKVVRRDKVGESNTPKLGSLSGRGPQKTVSDSDEKRAFHANRPAMAGDELVLGQGVGGLGVRGTGAGGGGEGIGRIGKLDTGGGRGSKVGVAGKKRAKRRTILAQLGQDQDSPDDGFFDANKEAFGEEQKRGGKRFRSSFKYDATLEGRGRLGGQTYAAGPGAARKQEAKDRAEPEEDGLDSLLPSSMRPTSAATEQAGWLRPNSVLDLPHAQAANQHQKPGAFLPRMAYFENTYLGRGADYREQLRALDAAFSAHERPYAGSVLPPQLIDAPTDAGLSLTATLSERGVSEPGRVFLQVALQGSERFGWRRPPLDVVLVVDSAVRASAPRAVAEAVQSLLTRLGPQDRLGIVDVGAQVRTTLPVSPLRVAQLIQNETVRPVPGRAQLAAGLLRAGALLTEAAHGQARVPGTGTVLLLTRGGDEALVARAAAAAHALSVQGAVTSVISLDDQAPWWKVAAAGHGNDHRGRRVADAIEAELESLSKVIARLLRVNIRLGPNARAVRVLGSRVLRQDEVKQVKAREEATDRNLSRTMGVKADRGEDDDGLQTVIPFFHGGDAHVILVELWVDGPGAVADVTLKYKDMVKLSNATARTSVRLEALTHGRAPAQIGVVRNLRGFLLAEAFADVAQALRRGDAVDAMDRLDDVAPVTRADAVVAAAFRRLLATDGRHADLSRALALAARSRISHAPLVARR